MRLEQSFEVRAPVESVWRTLTDVERVAPCLPGAEITEAKDDGSYEGSFKVKLGPTTAAYTGRLSMEELDEPGRRATMKASGRDKRGQGSANATIVSTLQQAGGATRVEVETDFTITGRLARFGRGGMIEDISNRLLGDFADCLQKSLETEGGAATEGRPAQAPGSEEEPAVPAPGAGRPPTASPGPAPAATGEADASPPAPPAEPAGAPAPGPASEDGAPEADSERRLAPAPAAGRSTPQPAKPVSGLSLFFSVLVERVKRLFRRGGRRS